MANRLSTSASPYLRQHADNPVDWWEWGPEPFEEAARRDVPVILSVGYSSCHWCHVMAHESFEDESTAEIMNRDFVNVKVDREERPDVDAVYMEAVQALTGRGGWPMTVWLTPDAEPFYAGTYFPDTDRPGMPSFTRVLGAITDSWQNDRQTLLDQAGRLTDAIDRDIPTGDEAPDLGLLRSAYEKIVESADPINGGIGTAPKFPQAPVLEFLLRVSGHPWAGRAAPVVRQTLVKMARGGIYDHVIGGFARYSVDAEWLVPHFEKMLYDNAQLARIYLRAGQALEDPSLWTIARETLDYLNQHLRHPDGGYFSAQDADSEGEEGKFAVFTHTEFVEIVGDDAEIASMVFGVTPAGNFEGANVLHRAMSIAEAAEALGIERDDAEAAIDRAIQLLRRERARRVPPGLDDKVVTSWNGLAIRAFAEAGAVLGEDGYLDDARSCAAFLLENLVDADGRLLRSWAGGRASVPGFLEDHASLAVGLLSLYQATGETRWYSEAERLVVELRRLFTDARGGAMFTTGADAERLIARKKDQMDNPLPSGNSLAAEALIQLGHYTGDLDLIDDANGILTAGRLLTERYPSAVGHLLAVATSALDGIRELAVTGPDAHGLASVAWEEFRPNLVIAVDPEGREPIPLLENRHRPGETLAYVCEHFTCAAPVSSTDALRAALSPRA